MRSDLITIKLARVVSRTSVNVQSATAMNTSVMTLTNGDQCDRAMLSSLLYGVLSEEVCRMSSTLVLLYVSVSARRTLRVADCTSSLMTGVDVFAAGSEAVKSSYISGKSLALGACPLEPPQLTAPRTPSPITLVGIPG
jgi:hypothetical protein